MAKPLMKVLGIIFVIIGALGFFLPMDGMFNLTMSHNLIHLISGIIFLAVSGNDRYSQWTSRVFGILYLTAAVWGLFTDDILGLIMATPATNLIHFIVGALALYAGFRASSGADRSKSA